jgi:hypothetical protein
MGERYTFTVAWSAEDGEYVATCAECPSLSWLAPTQDEALAGLKSVIEHDDELGHAATISRIAAENAERYKGALALLADDWGDHG